MIDEGFLPDGVAELRLTPLMEEAAIVLAGLGADDDAARRIVAILGTTYAAGLVDGARHAVGEVAVEAGRRGLVLTLAPELQAREDRSPGPGRPPG